MILNPHLFVLTYNVDKVVAQKSNWKDLVLLEAVVFGCLGLFFWFLLLRKKKKKQVDL